MRHRFLLVPGALLLLALAPIPFLGDLRDRMTLFLLLWAAAHAAYLVAARHAASVAAPKGTRNGTGVPLVLAIGLLARVCVMPADPSLSEDVYRYLWDGRLVAQGVNPFPHAPADPALGRFHGDLSHRLNHAEVRTIYPPAAQLLFGVTARVAPTPGAWKFVLLALELALVIGLLELLRGRGLPPRRLLLYYWNPLVIVETYGSGHLDLAAAAFLVLAIALIEARRAFPAGIAFALAVLTKWVAVLLAPWLLRRRAWLLLAAAAGTAAILFAPFWEAGSSLWTGLITYARHWEFNGALYRVLQSLGIADGATRKLLAAGLVAATLGIAVRVRTAPGAAFATMTAFLVLSPTVFPWYAVPAVAFLPLYADAGLLVFSGLLALSYVPLPLYRATGLWALPDWILWVEYGGLALAWGIAAWARSRRRASQERAVAWSSESTPT